MSESVDEVKRQHVFASVLYEFTYSYCEKHPVCFVCHSISSGDDTGHQKTGDFVYEFKDSRD